MSPPDSCNDVRRRRMACMACRIRKVKCVLGPTQRCERCTAFGFTSCVYEQTKEPGTRNNLGRREACRPCRAKKRKCDAERPCTRCVYAGRTLECEYDSPSEDIQFIAWSGPAGSDDVPVQEHEIVGGFPEVFIKSALVAPAKPAPKTVPRTSALIRSFGCNSTPPHLSPNSQPHTIDIIKAQGAPRILFPPVPVLSSIKSPKVPPEPHVTLLSLGTGRFQLSNAALGELDMKFRLNILCRLNKMGVLFTSQKQQALLRGDTSGTIIHPFFIPAAQSLGMHFCKGMDDSPAMIRLQARHLQTCLELIVDVFKRRDQELIARVALWIVAGSFILPFDTVLPQYLVKGCGAIDAAGLRFVPTYGRPPEFSEDLHEKLSLLTQAIYLENFVFLTCGGAEPTMSARLEKEFRHQLQEVYPVLFRICPLTMRTQAILLVRDTVVILNRRPTEETRFGIWRQSCDQLVFLLDSYSQTLLFNLQRFQELGDKGGAGVIQSSCISCLAHLAVLCEALYRVEHQTQLETLWDSTLERLGELTGDVPMEEFTRLDLLLGASWRKALGVFDARLATVPPEGGEKLRHWREVVAGVYSDFAAKLPDAELPPLAARAFWEDGRTEGSPHPNLLLPHRKNR